MVLEKILESSLDGKEINPELKRLMPKLKLQYYGHLMWRADSLEKTLKLGKIEHRRSRGQQRTREMIWWHHLFNEHEFEQTLGNGEGQGSLECCSGAHGVTKGRTQLVNEQQMSVGLGITEVSLFLYRTVYYHFHNYILKCKSLQNQIIF